MIDCSSGYELFSKINTNRPHICTSRLDVIVRYLIKKPTHHLNAIDSIHAIILGDTSCDFRLTFRCWTKIGQIRRIGGGQAAATRPAVFQWCSFWEGTLKHCCSFVVCICGLYCSMPECVVIGGDNVGLDLCLVS